MNDTALLHKPCLHSVHADSLGVREDLPDVWEPPVAVLTQSSIIVYIIFHSPPL